MMRRDGRNGSKRIAPRWRGKAVRSEATSIEKAYNQYGASMGRRDVMPDDASALIKLNLIVAERNGAARNAPACVGIGPAHVVPV